jgi:hypothetical protein
MGVDGSGCWVRLKLKLKLETGRKKSHDGKNLGGHHRKNIPNVHEIDLISPISCDRFTYLRTLYCYAFTNQQSTVTEYSFNL